MRNLIQIQQRYQALGLGPLPASAIAKASAEALGASGVRSSERGARVDYDTAVRRLHRSFWVDPDLRSVILDIRHMDTVDPRVKRIHAKTCRDVCRGGLLLDAPGASQKLQRKWKAWTQRLGLCNPAKLESDARGLVVEGNLPMQWVLGESRQVVGAVRMPAETIVPIVNEAGRIDNPAHAYEQREIFSAEPLAVFAAWQLTLARLDPRSWDDQGSMGRPYLDACRRKWRQLDMTEDDLVLRRHTRAPKRTAHFLDGADEDELKHYIARIEDADRGVTNNYYSNKAGSVVPISGDESLGDVEDVVLLLDSFFSGAPAPKGLFGYSQGLNRDILEDLRRDYFDEIDAVQNLLQDVYRAGFRLQLLLDGDDPDAEAWAVQYKERRTETPNQGADRALKYQALGASQETIFRAAGLDPADEKERLRKQASETDPYPDAADDDDDDNDAGAGAEAGGQVRITPGNGRKGDSATTISTRSA